MSIIYVNSRLHYANAVMLPWC